MTPSAESELLQDLESLPEELRALLRHYHFDPQRWVAHAEQLWNPAESQPACLRESVEPPPPSSIAQLPAPGSAEAARLRQLGEEALAQGACALVVLAGGMATRMGSVVKALVHALPERSFLSLRVAEQRALAQRYGKTPPLWLMTSPATGPRIEEALGEQLDSYELATFPQSVSLRLTPDGQLFRDEQGAPSLYATGHGDLPEALQKSELLTRFVDAGGRYILVTNLDNLGGGLDPLLIGFHLDQEQDITCELVEKRGSDRGGIPVQSGGRVVIREEFLLPPQFDPQQVRVFNSNSLAFNPQCLVQLSSAEFSYYRVEKQVQAHTVIQFERLIHEATAIFPTRYVQVERDGPLSRFLPVKNYDDLHARQAELFAVAQDRGMLEGDLS